MKSNSILQLKHVVWGSASLVVVILLVSVTHLGRSPQRRCHRGQWLKSHRSSSEMFPFTANGSGL